MEGISGLIRPDPLHPFSLCKFVYFCIETNEYHFLEIFPEPKKYSTEKNRVFQEIAPYAETYFPHAYDYLCPVPKSLCRPSIAESEVATLSRAHKLRQYAQKWRCVQ